jgi:vitamin B12 transporter
MPHGACGERALVLFFRISRSLQSLGVACGLAMAALGSAAQPQTLVVTAGREPLARHQVAADLVVIDAERIGASGADSLEDLLRREAGLQVLRNGGPGQSAGLSIRGAARGHTLLLIDGVRVGSATLGTPELDTLGLAGIDRIEVLRGPGSSLYGADALGGVVHVITRRAGARPAGVLRIAAGGYGAREASLAGELREGPLDVAASLAEERLRGTTALRAGDPFGSHNPDDDGSTRRTANAQLGFTPQPGHRVGLMLRGGRLNNQYDASEFPPPTFAPDSSGDFRNRVRDDLAALDYRGQLAPAWVLGARAADAYSRSVSGATALSRFATRREQGSVQLSHALGSAAADVAAVDQLTLALEHLDETASSTDYAADAARRNRAWVLAYAGALPVAPGLQAQAELREDRNSAYGNHTTGRLGVRWPLAASSSSGAGAAGAGTPAAGPQRWQGAPSSPASPASPASDWSLRALAGTSFRAPSFNDLVYPNFGVPTIRPEKGRSVEVGVDWQGAGGQAASLTLYRQNLRDLIGFESDPARCPAGFTFGCAANVQSARLQGASLDGRAAWGGGSLTARLEWLEATDRTTGQTLPRRAEQQASIGTEQQLGPWRLAAELLHVGERADFGTTLGAYTTLELLATWRVRQDVQLQAKLLNASDRDIEPLRGYQALGRQAWLVLRWQGAW